MERQPHPMLDSRLAEEFSEETLKPLEVWCQNSRISIDLENFLDTGKTRAKVAVVLVYNSRNEPRRRVLKHCPPQDGISLDARKFNDANSASEKFAQAHLVALDAYVPADHGGIFLLMEWRGGGSQNYLPLTSFLDKEALGDACSAVVKSILSDWQKDRRLQQTPGRRAHAQDVLQAIAGEKCMPGRSLHSIACDLGIEEASRLSIGEVDICNPFLAVSQKIGLREFYTAGIRGNGHGDLHPGNILVPGTARAAGASKQFDKYFLIDLSCFDDNRFLAIDPAHLTLSLANEQLGELSAQQQDRLRELILDPADADAGNLPSGIARAVRAISQAGRVLYDTPRQSLFEDWYQETLLAVAGCALLFVGRNTDFKARLWFLQLGGMAIDKVNDFVTTRTGGQATSNPPGGATVPKPPSAEDKPPASNICDTPAVSPVSHPKNAAATGPTAREQNAEGAETEDADVIPISPSAQRLNEVRTCCLRFSGELNGAIGDLPPYLPQNRGIAGTGVVRDALLDLTEWVAALRRWYEENLSDQRIMAATAMTFIETRLRGTSDLTHQVHQNGCTPATKNQLAASARDLDQALRSFFKLELSDQPPEP